MCLPVGLRNARALTVALLVHAASGQEEDGQMRYLGGGLGGGFALVLLIVIGRLALTWFLVNKEPYRDPGERRPAPQLDNMAV